MYWAGPILGGVTASLLYSQVLSAPEETIEVTEKYRTSANEKEVSSHLSLNSFYIIIQSTISFSRKISIIFKYRNWNAQ